MKAWIATLAALSSYSQVAAADQTPEQIQQLEARIALYPDAPVLGASTDPNEGVEADRLIQQHSSLKTDQLVQEVDKRRSDPGVSALTQSPSVLTDLSKNLSPAVGYVPAYDLSQVDGPPLMVFPGWVPIEGAFTGGPGISFGVGYLGGVGWGGVHS